jgi:hypothetical protein
VTVLAHDKRFRLPRSWMIFSTVAAVLITSTSLFLNIVVTCAASPCAQLSCAPW